MDQGTTRPCEVISAGREAELDSLQYGVQNRHQLEILEMTSMGEGNAGGDTSQSALHAQYAALRRIPVWRRIQLMDQLTLLAQTMAKQGLRRRNPNATAEQLEALYFEMVLGAELAAKVLEHRQRCRARIAP